MLGVPFVDVIATMSDPALPATVTEYEVIALTLLILSCIHLRFCRPVSQQCLTIELIAVNSSPRQAGLYLQSTLCGHYIDTDVQEWGNPVANKSTYDLMLSYSPMDNIIEQPYPSMLAIGGMPLPLHAKTKRVSRGRNVMKGMRTPVPPL